jgi:hypothetical protein
MGPPCDGQRGLCWMIDLILVLLVEKVGGFITVSAAPGVSNVASLEESN